MTNIQQALQSEEMKKAIPYLLLGGVGAAGGAYASRGKKRGESRKSYIGRVLKNALIAGGLAGGGGYLLGKGLSKTVGNIDKDNPLTGSKNNEGPLTTGTRNVLFSKPIAAISGGLGLAMTHNTKGVFGAGVGQRTDALNEFSTITGESPTMLNTGRDSKHIGDLVAKGSKGVSPEELDKIRRAAGLASDTGEPGLLMKHIGLGVPKGNVRGFLSRVTRKGPLSTFGQTSGGRARRLAIGAGFSLAPGIIGAITTSDKEE